MAWNAKYVLLLLGMTLITFFMGLFIDYLQKISKQQFSAFFLIFAITCNIGLLIYFKYMNMFTSYICKICNILGFKFSIEPFNILLPVGISFISFQSLGYVIDVYTGKIRAEKNPFKYALFIAFFPQLVAGPIERSENLLSQIQTLHKQPRISYETFTNGFILMLYGYFQKIVLGDKIKILVDNVFASPEQYNSLILLFGAVAFAIQIYCDFGGYSNIAIGAAQVLGFGMMENFNTPYFAPSIKDFWRRWHISLSTWFRDYLYIPLGGNQRGRIRKYTNLMVTFLISGLWHGAHGHYVIWGGIHGAYQIIEDIGAEIFSQIKLKYKISIKTQTFSFKTLQVGTTFILTTIAWVFFRAESTSMALRYLKKMFTPPDIGVLFNGAIYQLGLNINDFHVLLLCLVILFLFDLVRYKDGLRIEKYLCTQNLWFKWLACFILIFCVIIFGEYGLNYNPSEFIYFQF